MFLIWYSYTAGMSGGVFAGFFLALFKDVELIMLRSEFYVIEPLF